MIEHTFFLPIFTAAMDEKYFSNYIYIMSNKPITVYTIPIVRSWEIAYATVSNILYIWEIKHNISPSEQSKKRVWEILGDHDVLHD